MYVVKKAHDLDSLLLKSQVLSLSSFANRRGGRASLSFSSMTISGVSIMRGEIAVALPLIRLGSVISLRSISNVGLCVSVTKGRAREQSE